MQDEASANEKLQRERDEELKDLLKQATIQRQAQLDAQQQQMENVRRRLEMKEKNMDIKIMLQDPNTISDPIRRAFIIDEQARISRKKYEEQLRQHGASNSTNAFGTIFDNIGGSGADFPHYYLDFHIGRVA